MANNSPTLVMASLSDDQLKKSIDSLVTHVDEAMNKMVKSTNNAVGEMEAKLKSLGNLKIDSGGSADGGASKRAKAQNAETEAIEKNIAARDRQIKKNQEVAMTFDQMGAAIQKASRMPPEMRPEKPENRARDSYYIAFIQGYKQQAEQIRSLMEEEQKAMQQRRQGVVDGFTKTIEERKARVKELSEEVAKLYKERPDGYRDSIKQRTEEMNALKQKIKELTEAQKNLADSPIGASNRFLELEKEYNRIKNIMIDTTNAQRQSTQETEKQAQAQKQVTQGAKEYSEQVKQIAAEVRASANWQQTDKLGFRRGTANIDGRSMPVVENLQMGLVLEEQIEQAIQRVNAERQKGVTITQQQSEAERKAAELLGWTETQQKKRYVAPITNIEQISAVRGALEAITGQQEKWVDEINKTKASYNELSRYVKELKGVYLDMERGGNTNAAKALAQEIQTTERAMQKFVQTMSRPVSLKAAMGLDEKTLDDIAYKMRQLASYRSGLNVDTQKKEIQQVNDEYNRLKKRMDEVMQKNQQMIASNTALGRSWNYMKNRLAFYFTVGASTQFVKNLIDIRGQYELLDRSIGILIDSAQNGSQIFAELNAMAIKSPFTTMELGAAAKQLVAYDVAAKDVVDTTRRLADMAAAVGIPIERLTYALGQIKAYGYLNARDARMFANAGIPLVNELADYYTELEGRLVSTADVYDRIKKKAIDYNDVMNVVNKMTDEGGKFFNFQEKAADTLKVRIANLTLAWNNMLNEMGKDNQGILAEGLNVTKKIFESWRDINNMVIALGATYGTIKAAQIAYYLWVMRTEKAIGAWAKIISAIDYAFNAKIANVINSLKTSLVGFFTNPTAMLTVAFTALSVALTKAYLDYRDLQAANEEFNKSVVENAEENIKSIDKFFEDYKKQLESVGSLNSADQTKLWERVQEEIEKTTKNAEKYIEILNKIPEISKRIEMGEEVLEQSKRIQDELKRMAERGEFNVGGGFANDSAAKDLQQYGEIVNELIRKYGTLDKAKKEALKVNEITLETGEVVKQYTGKYVEFQRAQIEAEEELQNIMSTLDKINIAEVLGNGDIDTQLANIRAAAIDWRDAFLATERGSKISAEGQTLLNSYIDKWIVKQARVNHLIKDENTAAVEANRTAWEEFFRFLSREERKRLDVAIKTNQLGSKSVQELWDNAAKRMQENATTSYSLIQQQIADLRNTPDIVINVVYRNNKEKLEKDQEEFEKKYIQPKNWGILSTDEYIKQEKANREKYGTLMRKQGEDTAEYEKRISDERKSQLELQKKNGDIIEENKNKTDDFSKAVTEQARKEKKLADDRLNAIKEIEDAGGYDFSTKSERAAANKAAKQAESELQKALKDELSTIDKVRSIYKDLTKEGMSHADAVERATEGWGETVNAINKVLQKNGLKKLDLTKFAGITNPRELVDMLQSQLDILVKRGAKAEEIKELQTKIRTLNVDADKYDLTRITKGLNSELDKLKEEYELAVELDANPEFGSVFADMFGINMETLPRTAKEYAERATKELNKYLSEKKSGIKIGNLLSLTDDDLRMFQERVETDGLSQEWVDNIIKAAKDVRDAWKKETSDTIKNWNSLVEKYGEIQAKITKINKDSSAQIKDIVMQYGSDKQKSLATRLYDNLSKEQNPVEIEKLRKQIEDIVSEISEKYPIALKILVAIGNANKRQISQALWEDFKNGDLYTSTFEDMERVSTFTIKRILDELERLKNKVKDDPASMKALMKSMDDARNKLQERNPFKTLSESIEKLKKKRIDVKKAKESLDNAKKALDDANRKGNEEESVKNIKKVEEAEKVLSQTSDELTASLQELKKAQEGVSAAMQSLAGIISTTSDITKALGGSDDSVETLNDLAESINGVTEAAEGITDIVTGAESGNILTIIQGAQKTIEGTWKTIDTWLDNSDKRRTRSIERSQMAIKHLELAYIDLQHAVDKAYGMATIGAQKAAIANKELQLVELKRQLALEQGRKKKYRDNARIVELQQQIKELQYEIQDATDSIVNDMLGISSVGDAMENLMDGLIDALRSGEDAMAVFDENIDNMIANMIKKMLVTKVLQPWFENVWEQIQMDINKRGGDAAKLAQEQLSLDDNQLRTQMANQRVFDFFEKSRREGYTGYFPAFRTMQNFFAKGITDEDLKAFRKDAQRRLTEATSPTMEDLRNYAGLLEEGRPVIENALTGLNEALKQFGIDKKSLELSSLQQGISQITENTAGAIESYLNGVSQQVYYHSSLLEQIRDSVVGLDLDVSLGVQSQMLLQLQNSYQTQQAIQQILEGVLVPSGRAFAVELIS